MFFLRSSYLLAGATLIWVFIYGPLKPYARSITNNIEPQLILVLGGDVAREYEGIKKARELDLPIILSGGSNLEYATWLTKKLNLPPEQITLDYRAYDTLTNFTFIIDELKYQGINHILLVTSTDHLSRAMAIGFIVSGSRGIKLTSFSIPCEPSCQPESVKKKLFDLIRAIVWVIANKDLKQLGQVNTVQSIN